MADTDLRYRQESGSGSDSVPPEPDEYEAIEEPDEEALSQEDGEGAFDSEPDERQPSVEEGQTTRSQSPQTFAPPPGVPEVLHQKMVEGLGEELTAVVDAYIQTVLGQREQHSAHAQYYVHQDSLQHPDWYRENAGSLNRVMGQMSPSARGTKEGLDAAKMAVLFEELQQTGDWPGTLRRHAELFDGKKAAPRPSVMPSKERVPAAGSAGTPRSAPARSPGKSTVESRIAARWGKNNAAALLEED